LNNQKIASELFKEFADHHTSDSLVYGDRIFAFWHETGKVKPLADDLSSFEIE
jgi:hypothetical protein